MKLCKTTSVFYYFLAFLYAVAAGGAILGWILSGAASVMFGDLGMVLISAVIIAALVLILYMFMGPFCCGHQGEKIR